MPVVPMLDTALSHITMIDEWTSYSRHIPYLIEDSRGNFRLVLRKKAPVVFRHHLWRVLDRVAGLLIGPGLLENMCREHVTHVVWPVRQQTFDRATSCPRVVNTVPLDHGSPSLEKCVLGIGGIGASDFRCLDEKCAGVRRRANEARAVPIIPGID